MELYANIIDALSEFHKNLKNISDVDLSLPSGLDYSTAWIGEVPVKVDSDTIGSFHLDGEGMWVFDFDPEYWGLNN